MAVWRGKGRARRTPEAQVALAVRVLDERHVDDVLQRMEEMLGDRKHTVGRPDLSRNPLGSWCTRLGRAYQTPPLVVGLREELAHVCGDYSAATTADRYEKAGGRPLPTVLGQASNEALRYRLGAGYAGVLPVYSQRSDRLSFTVISPDDLELIYGSDDATEPTIIRHRCVREVDGQVHEVVEVYDLTDLDAPSYKVMKGDDDITDQVHGHGMDGDAYWWRYDDGKPFHPIVVTGHPDFIYRTNPLVEASLTVATHWTSWGAGVLDGGFPQRNVRGMRLAGMDSNADTGQAGMSVGPETILVWEDTDPERPGSHWQDGPGYDPEGMGRAIRVYETSVMSALGLPVDYEATGGEPTEQERRAMLELIATTYPECRRFDGELLRRCAAIVNALDEVEGEDFSEEHYGVLYREEIDQALQSASTEPLEEE